MRAAAAARIGRAATVAVAVASLSACTAEWLNREPRLVRYVCQLEAEGPFGKLWTNVFVSPDGRRVRYSRMWTAELDQGRLSLRMDWRDPTEAPPADARVRIALSVPRERRSWSRFQMRRDGLDGALVYSTSSFNPPQRWLETMRWDRLAAAMGDASALHVALVRRDREIVAQALLPRAILDAPAEAAAAIRPELVRHLANPADHCWPETDPPLVIA